MVLALEDTCDGGVVEGYMLNDGIGHGRHVEVSRGVERLGGEWVVGGLSRGDD